jgi:hypothetical protein
MVGVGCAAGGDRAGQVPGGDCRLGGAADAHRRLARQAARPHKAVFATITFMSNRAGLGLIGSLESRGYTLSFSFLEHFDYYRVYTLFVGHLYSFLPLGIRDAIHHLSFYHMAKGM